MRTVGEQQTLRRRLGRKGIRHDGRTLWLPKYIAKLPSPPPLVDHTSKVRDFPMLANDQLGDCVMAAFAHGILDWTTYASTAKQPSESQVVNLYNQLSPEDQGLVVLDALNYWRKPGCWGDTLYAFANLNAGNTDQAEAAISYFGFAVIGMALPDNQTFGPWDTDPVGPPDFNNGHCVILTGYNRAEQMFDAISWGSVMPMSYAWYSEYAGPQGQGEAYALLSQDWLSDAGVDPDGVDWTALQQDLKDITGVTPPPPPPPGPGPQPKPPGPGCFGLPKSLLSRLAGLPD